MKIEIHEKPVVYHSEKDRCGIKYLEKEPRRAIELFNKAWRTKQPASFEDGNHCSFTVTYFYNDGDWYYELERDDNKDDGDDKDH